MLMQASKGVAMRRAVIDWLLEEDNPPVRYLALTRLLNKPAAARDVVRAKSRLMDYSLTQEILRRRDEFWGDDDRAYWKYTGKYWQLIFLGLFLADGKDSRIAGGALDVIEKRRWVNKSGGQCLTANILAAATRLGYGDHPVVKQEREALAKRIVGDGGLKCTAMDYSPMTRCYMAQPKQLLCFAQVPAKERSRAMSAAVKLLVDRMLEHEVYVYVPGNRKQWRVILERQPKAANLPKGQTVIGWISGQRKEFLAEIGLGTPEPKSGWLKFGFPLHYNSDILEAMHALALLGVPMSPRLEKPLQIIQDKMTPDGKWVMENSLNGKMWVDVEEKGKPSKWLTFFALLVLNHFQR